MMKMKLSSVLCAFALALALGAGMTLLSPNQAQADLCVPNTHGPLQYLSCDTGANCSEPTPYYEYDCYGHLVGGGGPCDCVWIGCWDGFGC